MLITKILKYLFSPIVISIFISICLLVNLFIPRFTPLFLKGKDKVSCEEHICGCNLTPHSSQSCCCVEIPNTNNRKNLQTNNSKELFSAFIQSLACEGGLDIFAVGTCTISLPEESEFLPDIFRFVYLNKLKPIYPYSFQISPPEKPPRTV